MNAAMLFIPGVVMLTPIVILVILLRYRSELTKARYRTLLQLAEKGVAIPGEMLIEPHANSADRRRGLVLISAGLGVIAMFLALPIELPSGQRIASLWGVGLLPLMTGFGYVAPWWLNRRDGVGD